MAQKTQEIPPLSFVKLDNFPGWVYHQNADETIVITDDAKGCVFFSGGMVYYPTDVRPGTPTPPPPKNAVQGWWYGIGDTPTDADLVNAAKRYSVVVLNAWETAALRRIKALNPAVKVLVYKCLASTRSYSGAVDNGKDAKYLPAGVGYVAAKPEWFAKATDGSRIQWNGYGGHWQMAVWDSSYRDAWINNVSAEVAREGWDGVLADNDMNTLRWYSDFIFQGTLTQEASDAKLRAGLDAMIDQASYVLSYNDKEFIPNISESHVRASRWTRHCGTKGAMEENFATIQTNGILSFMGTEFSDLVATATAGKAWMLLLTKGAKGSRAERTGYATAALLSGPKTCWQLATTDDYRVADWSSYQDKNLGVPIGPPFKNANGSWSRVFSKGFVAVNPTLKTTPVTLPSGVIVMVTPGDGYVTFT